MTQGTTMVEPTGPFMRLFVDMWLDPESRIYTLTAEQERAYFRLCLFQFRAKSGLLPGDPALLCTFARESNYKRDVLHVLEAFFIPHENGWSHPRVRAEWERMNEKSAKARFSATARTIDPERGKTITERQREAGAIAQRSLSGRSADAQRSLGVRSAIAQRPLSDRSAEYRKENIEARKEKEERKDPTRADAREVLAYWKASCSPKAVETEDRIKVLIARLREEPGTAAEKVEGLKRAVQGALVDPFFNGTEKGGARLWGFENIFKHSGRDRIEKLQASAARFGTKRRAASSETDPRMTSEQVQEANRWRDDALKAMREGKPLPAPPK